MRREVPSLGMRALNAALAASLVLGSFPGAIALAEGEAGVQEEEAIAAEVVAVDETAALEEEPILEPQAPGDPVDKSNLASYSAAVQNGTRYYVDGEPHSPEVVNFYYYDSSSEQPESIYLEEGTDYEFVSYVDAAGNVLGGAPTKAGTYYATYKGIGSISGTKQLKFELTAERSLTNAVFFLGKYPGDSVTIRLVGNSITINPWVADSISGATLKEGTHYRLEFLDRTTGATLAGVPNSVGSYSVRAVGIGDYTGSTDFEQFEVVAIDNVTTVAFGEEYSGSLSDEEPSSYYKFTLPQASVVRISGSYSWEDEPGAPTVKATLLDSEGETIMTFGRPDDADLSGFNRGAFSGWPLSAGTYCLVLDGVSGYNDTYDISYTLSLSSTPIEESFPETTNGTNNSTSTASPIQPNTAYKGLISYDDSRDYYEVTLPSSGVMTLSLDWMYSEFYDFYMPLGVSLTDADGNELWNGNRPSKANLVSDPIEVEKGIYYVCVYYAEKGLFGTYDFTVGFSGEQLSISDAVVASIPDQAWTGKAVTPAPLVKLGGVALVKDTDYELSYVNNVNPGTATVTVTGKGNYSGTVSSTFTVGPKTGTWKKSGSRWWYRYADGSYPKAAKATIEGSTYGFDGSGWMQTGWAKHDGDWYYFASSGKMATGWVKSGSSWYYMDPETGVMRIGWLDDGGARYYLKASGAMATGWLQISGQWYYFAGSGKMATGWVKSGSSWYYMNEDGTMATGWLELPGKTYWLKSSGAMATGWQKIEGKWYYFGSSGDMARSKWVQKYYYLDADGVMMESGVTPDGYRIVNGKWDGKAAVA